MAVFAGGTANGEISNGGLTYRRASGTATANVKTDTALSGKQYVEMRIVRATTGAVGVGLYANTQTMGTGGPYVLQHWDSASAAVSADAPWSLSLRANNGDGALYDGNFVGLPGTSPVDQTIAFAVDTATRQVWVKRVGDTGWYGGGDPATGTTPSFVLIGSNPIHLAATSNNAANYAHLQTVAQHVGTTPAGFTNYMAAAPAPGAIAGTTALALATTGTLSVPPAGPIAGTTALALAAAGTLTPPPASHPIFDSTTLTANGALSNGARTLTHNGGAGSVANVLANTAIVGKQYLEFEVSYTSGGVGGQLLGEPYTPLPINDDFGLLYLTGSMSASILGPYSVSWAGNYGSPTQLTGYLADLPGTLPAVITLRMAVDATTRQVWVQVNNNGWHGGGDPAAGTTPSLVLINSGDIYPGARAGPGVGTATLQLPEDYLGAPPVGFTDYMLGESPPAEGLDGVAALTLNQSATLRARAALTGVAALTFNQSATLRARAALTGAAALALDTTGTARTRGSLAGTTALALDTTGALRTHHPLVGTAALALGTGAALSARAALSGTTPLALDTTGTLTGAAGAALVGATGLAFSVDADLTARAGLAGASTLTLDGTAALTGRLAATGQTALALTASGQLAARARLNGATALTLSGAATLRARGGLAGTATLALTGTAQLAGRSTLTGTATVTLTTAATPTQPPSALRGAAGLALTSTATPSARATISGAAGLGLAAAATVTAHGTLAGATGATLTSDATGRMRVSAVGAALLSIAAVGALLARASGRGEAAFVFHTEGHLSGGAGLAGATTFTLTARHFPGPIVSAPVHDVVWAAPLIYDITAPQPAEMLIVWRDHGADSVVYAQPPPAQIVYPEPDTGTVGIGDPTEQIVIS